MPRNITPGVYTRIIDLSEYVQNVPSTIGFIPIICERGPDNELVHTNARDFYRDFGEPDILYAGRQWSQGPYVCDSFLAESDSLYVVRVLPDGEGTEEGGNGTAATWSNVVLYYNEDSGSPSDSTVEATTVSNLNNDNSLEKDSVDASIGEVVSPYSGDALAVFYGVGRGEYYNNFQVEIIESANPYKKEDQIYVLNVYQKQTGVHPTNDDIDIPERFEIVDSFEVSFNPDAIDDFGDSLFVEDVLDRYSRYVKARVFEDVARDVHNNEVNVAEAFIELEGSPAEEVSVAIQLDNGNSGDLFDNNGRISSNTAEAILSKAYTGSLNKTNGERLDDVINTEDYYFNIVLDGGYTNAVKHQIDTLVRNERKDALALVDYGDNISPSAAESTRDEDLSFNTMYIAGFSPYSKIYDRYTGRNIWITPVYHMARIIPHTDNVAEQWFAPAGFNRASITQIRELRFNVTHAQRTSFYLNQINPIVHFSNGFVVYSQLTTQRRPSALQSINIVRLVLYVKRALKQFCEFFVFEQNDEETWAEISEGVNEFLEDVQARRGLYSYDVNVYANEKHKKEGVIKVDVTLTPVRPAERIYLDFFIK